jgi:hypothetical protein
VSVVRDWLTRLYGRSPGYFAVTAFVGGRPKRTTWFSTAEVDKAARAIERAQEACDVYVSCATHAEPQSGQSRGTSKTVTSISGLWADLDIGSEGHKPAALPNPADEAQALSILEGLPEPSAVVHSGGGLQVWWWFDEPWSFRDPAEAAQASEAWHRMLVERGEARGLHVDAVGDLPRILRVPGSSNHKLDTPRPVVVRQMDGPSYPASELASLGAPVAVRGTEPAAEDGSPLGSWAEILAPHGWTQAGTRATDGATLWVRPGKSASEGHSAVSDPYGMPVLVNFSASAGLPTGPGQRLTKFKVWAHLNFDGDEKAAKAALSRLTKDSPAKLAETAERFARARIDWPKFWTEVDPTPEWLCEPLIERGRQVACYSEAKAGKSLLWLEVSAGLATGRPVLGNPERDPVTVVYLDQENTRVDIRERLGKLGYVGADLSGLAYYTFPDLSYLDTETGGREMYSLATYHGADLVIIDTLSRVTQGDENENDTFHNFYKFTGVRLKAAGIGLVRLDHAGKDVSKGMRGASSKTTDVDEVWQLSTDGGDLLTLVRTHSRSNHGAARLALLRKDNPLRHEVGRDLGAPLPDAEAAEVFLDLQGIEPTRGINAVWAEVQKEAKEQGFSQALVREAQAARKLRAKASK